MKGAPRTAVPTAVSTAVLLCNLGTPDAPTAPAVRRYLAEFLADPRVVELPRWLWRPLLHGVILRVRPARSAAKYASIWTDRGSPLKVWTERQAALLGDALDALGHRVAVRHAMRYGTPSIAGVLDALAADGVGRVLVLPLYPQYSAATTASVVDAVAAWAMRTRALPELRVVTRYDDDAGYVDAVARRVADHWLEHGRPDRLVMSFHGIPALSIVRGDPYEAQCRRTAGLVAARLGLAPDAWTVAFQSRFGRARWLEPYTEPTVRGFAANGGGHVDVVCPGFVADCLETLEEISIEVRDAFLASGGRRFGYIACLNDRPDWIAALAAIAERHLQGWETREMPAEPVRPG